MKKKIIELLRCPNTQRGALRVYAKEVLRGNECLYNLNQYELHDNDDIKTGVLVNESGCSAYPIIDSVAVLLADDDVDYPFLKREFAAIVNDCHGKLITIIEKYLERLENKRKSGNGIWNLGEMRYYDKSVDTNEQREKMLVNIKKNPIWRIFIPRKNQITKFLEPDCQNNYILEIGCGNARTISWIFPPSRFNYHYIGIDISYKRLLVASKNIPEGDFIQASASHLPFKNSSFHSILSFGMLHHLPKPLDCIQDLCAKIKNNGFLAFHEPISKPKIIPKKSIFQKFFTSYEHSKHDNEIDAKGSLALLMNSGFKSVNLKYYNSVLKTFIEILLKFFPKKINNSKFLTKTIIAIDVIFLKTLGKISKRLGPHAIIGVFRKNR